MKIAGITIGALVAILALSWIFTGNDFFLYKYFAPKQENVRRQVFVNTDSFVEGKISSLSQERLAYESADAGAQKRALRTMILSEAAQVDNHKLPLDMQTFINSLKGGF